MVWVWARVWVWVWIHKHKHKHTHTHTHHRGMRFMMAAVPIVDIILQLGVFVTGVVFLLLTQTVQDLILNTMAV